VESRHRLTVGWAPEDLRRLRELAPGEFNEPEDIRRVIDALGYLAEWKKNYQIRSARTSLHSPRITCIDSAILSYGLLELLFADVKRRLLAIHRRDPAGEECGHCVTLYWNERGRIGAFSKSSFGGLGHRDAIYADELAIASSYADAYIKMGFEPLYFGVTSMEEVVPDLDWRFDPGSLNVISDRLKDRYQYAFMLAR
jgi:hypothetical protein